MEQRVEVGLERETGETRSVGVDNDRIPQWKGPSYRKSVSPLLNRLVLRSVGREREKTR